MMIGGNSTRTSTTNENNTINHETRTAAVEVEHPLQLPKYVKFANIDAPKLNLKAFKQNDSGNDQSIIASRKAKSWSTNHIVDATLSSAGMLAQQALAALSVFWETV
jgi:hypothetical protein